MKTMSSAIIALMLIVFVCKSFASENKITHSTFTVAATNDEWTTTNIKVNPGDILVSNEDGSKIVLGSFIGSSDANGQGSTGTGALFMKIGVGAGFKIGAHGYVQVVDSGVVKLRVNDSNYSDNSGSFVVNVIHIPAALIPPPRVVEQQ